MPATGVSAVIHMCLGVTASGTNQTTAALCSVTDCLERMSSPRSSCAWADASGIQITTSVLAPNKGSSGSSSLALNTTKGAYLRALACSAAVQVQTGARDRREEQAACRVGVELRGESARKDPRIPGRGSEGAARPCTLA